MNKLDTVGKRAAYALEERCVLTRSKKGVESGKIDINATTLSNWRLGKTEPGGYHLRQMALNGYDVMWILLGGDRNGK